MNRSEQDLDRWAQEFRALSAPDQDAISKRLTAVERARIRRWLEAKPIPAPIKRSPLQCSPWLARELIARTKAPAKERLTAATREALEKVIFSGGPP